MDASLAIAILAAGKGKRMKSSKPKVLFEICGKPALFYPLQAVSSLDPSRIVVVVGFGGDMIREAFKGSPLEYVHQKELKGTAHALGMTREKLADFKGDLMVLYGDGPLVKGSTLEAILKIHRSEGNLATVMTAVQDNPTGYGRVVRDAKGRFQRIVEEKDADDSIRSIREINTGITIYQAPAVYEYLQYIRDDNKQKEFYLTDLPQILQERGKKVGLFLHHDAKELEGFNDAAQYAALRQGVQDRILADLMEGGVIIMDPRTTYIDYDVEIGAGTRILPFTMIQGRVKIGEDCSLGPFTYVRDGSELEERVSIGCFVEVKNSRIGSDTLSRHLTYLGDSQVGKGANIGAGTITANFDGKKKNRTVIGDRAFIGSGAVIIAPAEIGEGCVIGAGAVVTRNTHTEPGSTYLGVPARKYEGKEEDR